jgi:hypothetical protein
MFAGNFNPGGTVTKILVNTGGFSQTVNINEAGQTAYNNNFQGVFVGTKFKIGRNGSGIQRSDVDLTEPFLAAPESGLITILPGGWNSGSQVVVASGLLSSVTTSDSIGECGIFCLWVTGGGVSQQFMISHDVAGGSFVGGQNVNVTYTWSIT